MDKMKMHTPNKADENYEKLASMFPNAVTETIDENGEVVRGIDKDVLMQEISCTVVEGRDERYQFTWPDKKKSVLLANAPIAKTLRPCREESVDFDNTENLYIEGDNLEVLKLLQETYLGKIKIIYIDPPYNTGNDFIYNDEFGIQSSEWDGVSGNYDEDGNQVVGKLEKNLEANGRFHTDWLNMLFPRLKMAKNLLSDDGVIFVSIGTNELDNMKKLLNEIFGAENCCGVISRVMKSGGAKGRFFSPNTEYIIVYARNINSVGNFREPISEEIINKLYTSIETEGERKGERYRPFGLYQSSLDARPNQRYYIECPDGELVIPPGTTMPSDAKDASFVLPNSTDGCWRWSRERYISERKKGNIAFKKSNGTLINSLGEPAHWNIYTKIWLSDRQEDGMVPVDLITKWENRMAAKELAELNIPFDFAKPTGLIEYLISIIDGHSDDIILDFFSGSATTANAVMRLNAEDGRHRKFIMVQLPEQTEENSEAYKAGYKNICEIGKERIRRAAKKIAEENIEAVFDAGIRVLKCDSTNMKDVYYNPAEYQATLFSSLSDNIKEDRTPEDLLFQIMLDLGVELSSKIEEKEIAGKKVFNVADGFLIACFDENVNEDTITEIAKKKPYYFVMRDSSMANDSVATNFDQLFTTYSADTIRKVL